MKKTIFTATVASALLLVGCGGDSNSASSTPIDLPNGKAFIFFDNASSAQYLYDTDTETYENMNVEGNNHDMTGKSGKLITWDHHTSAGVDQKVVMLDRDFPVGVATLTHNDFHYLGHFHEENNEKHFASHAPEEFDPAVSSDAKKAVLSALNAHLDEQAEIKAEIAGVLPSGEALCNFFVLGHEEHEEGEDHEAAPHIALTQSGKVYVFTEEAGELSQSQSAFSLDGVTACSESGSNIVKSDDHGVFIFSAQSQKLYLVDSHGDDLHVHSTWNINRFMPSGFTPTDFAGISEDDAEHDH
jgi:hypothetical protein